jgi:TRAP-type C4-dicarboxylate transport system permease small subunit
MLEIRDAAPETADVVHRDTQFDRILDGVAFVCKIITGVGLVVLTVIFGWLVYGRYVLNATPTWVEQVSFLLIMLITFIGAAVGIHENTHLGVNMFRMAMPTLLRRLLIALCHVVLGVFGAVMMWQSTVLAMFKWDAMIPLINVPEGLRAIPIAVCGGLIVLFSIGNLAALWRGYDEDHHPLAEG